MVAIADHHLADHHLADQVQADHRLADLVPVAQAQVVHRRIDQVRIDLEVIDLEVIDPVPADHQHVLQVALHARSFPMMSVAFVQELLNQTFPKRLLAKS
jgi:phosphotransacetylase